MMVDAAVETYLCEDAEIVLLSYGISSRIARTAAEVLRAEGIKTGVFRPITLNPFPSESLCTILAGRKAVVVELSCGQFRDDIQLHLSKTGKRYQDVALINHMGGVITTVDEVVAAVKKLL
jgi:pyruvate/2-oxoacid:ferredoxin oxidoreductase alpha subunit